MAASPNVLKRAKHTPSPPSLPLFLFLFLYLIPLQIVTCFHAVQIFQLAEDSELSRRKYCSCGFICSWWRHLFTGAKRSGFMKCRLRMQGFLIFLCWRVRRKWDRIKHVKYFWCWGPRARLLSPPPTLTKMKGRERFEPFKLCSSLPEEANVMFLKRVYVLKLFLVLYVVCFFLMWKTCFKTVEVSEELNTRRRLKHWMSQNMKSSPVQITRGASSFTSRIMEDTYLEI